MAGSYNLKFPLRSFKRGFFEGNNTYVTAVRENIKSFLLTKQGERLMDPTIGLPVGMETLLLFEQIDTDEFATIMKNHISNGLKRFFPYISLKDLIVFDKYNIPNGVYPLEENQILVRMDYTLSVPEYRKTLTNIFNQNDDSDNNDEEEIDDSVQISLNIN